MVPYEYLLSESQERMLFVAHAGREQELIDIFHRWGLQAVVAGSVIAEPVVRILFEGERGRRDSGHWRCRTIRQFISMS